MSEESAKAAGIDLERLRELIERAGPTVLLIIDQLLRLLTAKQAMQAEQGPTHVNHPHAVECCDAAIEHCLAALAELIHCRECCKP